MTDFPILGPPGVACPNPDCKTFLQLPESIPEDYFRGIHPLCGSCQKPLDWWHQILHTIREDFAFLHALAPVGARWTAIKLKLCPDKILSLEFSDHGIPPDARILQVTYTPQDVGGLFPLEIHGNTPQRHMVPAMIRLYPYPIKGTPGKETEVAVLVVWIPHTAGDEAWQNLVDAFDAYSLGRYHSAIIPANVCC